MRGDSYTPLDEKQLHFYTKLVLLGIVVLSIPLSVMISQQQQNTQNYAQGIQQRAEPPITSLLSPTMPIVPTLIPTEVKAPTPTLYCTGVDCKTSSAASF